MAETRWKKRRLVNPDRPGICIHLVSTAKGFWCSECIALKVGGYKP
jgi:hypothetical protein